MRRREMVKIWADATCGTMGAAGRLQCRPTRKPTSGFQAAKLDSRSRVKLFRLAFDAAVSPVFGRQQLDERYHSGDPVRVAGILFQLYDRDASMQKIWSLLDGPEQRLTTKRREG